MAVLSIFPLEKYAKRLFCHVGLLSMILIVLTTVDIIFHIWGRQIYRFGIGSIQLFYGHRPISALTASFCLRCSVY
ncbi:MAG: hypothetical protein II696_00060 [Firmicutes bacterium]|nr:hypothetical protein [Bacillota bacterium]